MIDAGIVLSLLAEKQAEVLNLRARVAELEGMIRQSQVDADSARVSRLVVPKEAAHG